MAKSKISAGFVKQVGWIGLQTGKSFVSDYTSNITQFLEDGKSMFNDMKQGKTKVVDAVNDIKANGGKKIADWFFDRSQETDGFGDWTNNSDSDFDAGYQVGDDGGDDTDQTPSKVLDEDSMKNIAGGQINAMYQIGAKQAEASMINAASITTSVDKGVASIVTAINNVNSSIATIGEKLDMITRVIVSQHDQEEAETSSSGNNGMFDSSGRVTLGSWWNNIKNQAKSGMDTVNTFLPEIMGSPSELLKEIIDFTGFRDKNLGTGIRNIANKFNIDEHEDRFINRLAEKLKGQTINTVGNDFNEWVGNGIHNILGGNAMPKFLNNALDQTGFVGSFIKDIIASSAGIRRNQTLQDGSSAVSEYNRDTAKFDNMVRTSIVEVIPDYLKIIAKGVTGKEYNVSISGHVTAQTKEERQREINNLMDYSANNGGVFSYELSKNISNKFSAHGVRGKGYDLSGMKKGSGKGSINEAFEEFDMDAARDQFGILAAFYFGDKLQHVAAFNNQLDDAFWDWLKEQLPAQLSAATGKDYEGKLKWMCLYYVDTVKNALEGSKSGVFNMNKEITSFLSNINSKADSIISSNNAAAKIAESFGRGDEYKAVTAKSFAEKYRNDEKSRNTEKEIEKIKEDLYKKVRDEILENRNITDEEFENWRYSGSKTKEGLKYRDIKRKVDEEYQKRLLTEKASIKQKQGGPDVIAFDEMTISKLEKAFEKSQEDASQVRTKEFNLNEDALFPKFAKDVVGLLTEIRDNTSGNPKPSNPSIILGNGDIPPLYNIWGHGDSASEDMEDDKMADALNMGAQAKLMDDRKFDNNDTALIQQQGSKMHNKKLGNAISQFWRKFGFSNKQADDRKEASGEDKSGGGLSSLFKGGILGFITKGAGTILKGVGSAIINVIAKPILKFMLKGFKSGFNDITSGVKTLFGLGGESDEEAKKNALTVTIPEKIEKIFGFLTNKQQKEDAREAAKVEKEKKKEEEKKAKKQKKQEAEERKVKKQYDKMQGMTEEQRTRLQQQWEHAANNENASEATRKKAQEKLALINAANKFDNDAYEQRQKQQKYERTRDRLQAYRDDETKSQEFRNRARTRLRQVNAENYGSNFQNALQSRQAYQEKRLAEFGEKINKVIPGFTKFAKKMAAAGKKIWSGAKSVVKGLGKAVLHPLKSFGKAITAVRDTVKKGFNGLVENIKQGGLNILEAGKAIKRQAEGNGGGIKGWSGALITAAEVGVGKVTSLLSGHKNETEDEKIARKEKSRATMGKVKNAFAGTGKILLGISKMVMTAVMSMAAIKTLITSIKNVFNKSMKKLEPAVTKIVKIIKPLVSKIGDTVSKLAEGLSKMVTSMQGVFKVLVNSIGKVLDSLMTALEPVMESVIRFAAPLQSLIEGLMPVVEVLLDVGGSLLTQFIDMTTGFVQSLLPLVDTVICPAIQTIAGVIQVIAGGIQSLIGVIESGLGHVVEGIGNLAKFFTKDDSLAETGRNLQKAGLEAMEGGVEQVERGKQTIKDAWNGESKTSNNPTTDDTDDSSTPTYDSKVPTLNAPNGASVDTYGSGDEDSTATSDGVEFGGESIYGELGGMLESIGVLLNNIAVPLNEDIVPLIKNQWTIYQEPLLTAINNTYKNLLKPQYELVGKIAGKQVEIADDILTPTMVTQEVDIKNDLEESVAQQKMTQGIIQNVGGNLLAANGLLLAAAGQTAAGNMLYQTAAGLSAQGMTTTTSGIQQYVNNNSQLLTGKYFNLSQLYPDDPYEGYGTTATTEEPATETPTEEVTTQPTTQSIPQVQPSSGQYREFYERGGYASGDSQGSFGSYLNMSQRGCGPVALADAANRRGGHINAGTLAGSMASSGRYSSSRGTSVGGFLDTAASLGMGYQAGGVTAGSLKRASANNPITLVGSGAGFGTRSGNTHFINVVGTDNSGGAYVSNPLSGRVERRSANDLVSGSVLGLYGSGDIESIPGGLFDLYGNGNITQKEFKSDTFEQWWKLQGQYLDDAGTLKGYSYESISLTGLKNTQSVNYSSLMDSYLRWKDNKKAANAKAVDIEYYKTHVTTGDTSSTPTQKYLWTADQAYRFYKNYMKQFSESSYLVNYYLKSHPYGLINDQKSFNLAMDNDLNNVRSWVTSILSIMGLNPKNQSTWLGWPDKLIALYQQYLSSGSESSTNTSSSAGKNNAKSTPTTKRLTPAEAQSKLNSLKAMSIDAYNALNDAYQDYCRSLGNSSSRPTFAAWFAGQIGTYNPSTINWTTAVKLIAGSHLKEHNVSGIEESLRDAPDDIAANLSSDSYSSSYDSASTGGSSFSVNITPGGSTGYVSTEAKYTPSSTSVEAPKTGSSFADRFKQAMSGLTNIWNNIMSIFSLSDKSDTEQAIEDAEEDKKEMKIRSEIGNEEYEQYEDLAWQAYMKANPQAQGESDATYQTRLKNGWTDKVKQKWMNKLASEQANMIDAQRYNSISDVQEGVGSTIYGGYNQETGLWEGGAWSTMGTSGNANSNVSSYNDPYGGKFVSDGGAIMWTDQYVPEITSTNISEDGGASQSQSPVHEFFFKTAGLNGGETPQYSFSNNSNWYTMRDNPDTSGVGSSGEEHKGVDIKTYPKDFMVAGKSELHAITGGTITDVRFAGKGNPDSPYNTSGDGGWGNSVEFTDAAGYRHRYAHMRDNPTVKVGDSINGGELLGVIGTTGDSTGEHLHYQINDPSGSNVVNPLTYFKYHQPTSGGAAQGAVAYEGITQDHDVWDVYQKRYADKWPSVIQDAYNNNMTPAETATILSTSIWEDGAEKVVGKKSLTATTYDGKGQRADGIMNWVSKDYKGDTVGEQMNYMKRRYFMDTPMDGFEYNGKYRKTSEYNQDIQAFKEMTGRSGYALALDSRYGSNLNSDLVEGSSHFYQLDLAPSKSHTASGLADYVGTAIGAYNWMISNGYGSLNPSSYAGNGAVDQSQIGQGTGAGNEDWTDTEGNKKTIWAYLTNTLGFSKEGAAGAMGNIYAESHYSPYALLNHNTDDYSIEYANKVNETGKFPSSDPYGIVQWLGSRRDKLLTHAKSSNVSIADLPMQLSFLSNELSNGYKDVNSNMKGATDVQTASDYWQKHFEVCGEATDKRRNAAKEAYEQFKNATNLDASSYGTTGSTATDLNNTLWINTLNRVIHETDVEGIHDYAQSSHPITLDGKTLSGRPDCTGMYQYALDYLGYDVNNISAAGLRERAESGKTHPITKDGVESEDFTAYPWSQIGKENVHPGDILVEPGHGEVGYGLVGSSVKGWNFGSDTGIAQTQAAAARMLNGETVQSVMEGDNIQNMSTPTYVIRPSGQLTVPVAGSASTGSSGIAGGVGMNIGKFNTALNSTAGRYGQTGLYRNSYSKTASFGNYAHGAMGGYANFVSPDMVGGSSYSGNSGATSTMISGAGTLPAGKGINITGVTATAPAKSSAVAGMSSSGLATQMNVPASQKDRIRKRSGKPTKVTWHTWADDGGSTDPQILTDWWDSRECSVNYGISDNGVIKQEIDEGYGSWTSSSPSNDSQAVTLEIANSSGARSMGEEWPISDAAMQSAINLTYDIAKRNGISQFNFTRKAAKPYQNNDGADGNWTYHRMFAEKSCPGDYIYDRTNDILNVINGALANTSATAQNSSLVNSITAAGDIPDIDMSKVSAVTGVDNGSSILNDHDNGILNSELLDETKTNTTNIIVNRVESDQNTMMDRILEHTFNVRAVQVEELLETIIEKMDHMATTKNEQPVAATVTQNQSSLFPSDDIPKQVQRLAQG